MTDANVDTDLYGRQIYAIGLSAMKRMLEANVLMIGCGGTTAEVAKNLVLGGLRSLTLADSKAAAWRDMSGNCFVSEEDVKAGTNRAVLLAKGVAKLNPSVTVTAIDHIPTSDEIILGSTKYTVVAFSDYDDHCCCGGGGGVVVEPFAQVAAKLRAAGVKICQFVTAGVHGRIANDYGAKHTVLEPSGSEPQRHFVEEMTIAQREDGGAKTLNLVFSQQEMSEKVFYDGARLRFIYQTQSADGADASTATTTATTSAPCNITATEGLSRVRVDFAKILAEDKALADYLQKSASDGGSSLLNLYAQPIEDPIEQEHKPISEVDAAKQLPVVMNFARDPDVAHVYFLALSAFQHENGGARPEPYSKPDAEKFVVLASNIASDRGLTLADADVFYARLFAFTAQAQLVAWTSFFGGVITQEILKGVSLKYVPVHQLWYFDARELIPVERNNNNNNNKDAALETPTDAAPTNDRYEGQVLFFGKKRNEKIQNSTIFIIGAGAIGCEYIKNVALCGIGAGPRGNVVLTDNDSIERSNLSRQFLFRNEHISKSKSTVAAAAAKSMNPKIKVRTLTEKVWRETCDPVDGTFNDRFWGKLDVICTAVDNAAARNFLDDMAVQHFLPLVDSGTLGPLGHIEVVLPHLSSRLKEGPAAGDDAKKIPFCTIHFFPTTIDHCIQYARDMFAHLYTNGPQEVNKFLDSSEFDAFVEGVDEGARETVFGNLHALLVAERPTTFEHCIIWARRHFERTFVHSVKQLMYNYPPDKKEEDGKPYWGGARKMPKLISFDPDNNVWHRKFAVEGVRLMAEAYKLPFPEEMRANDFKQLVEYAKQVPAPTFEPTKMVIPTSGDEEQPTPKTPGSGETEREEMYAEMSKMEEERRQRVVEEIRTVQAIFDNQKNEVKNFKMDAATFEKDDDANGHVAVITAISNIRASCYGIPAETELQTKKIAGRIIPAMITTTAAVTGFATIQLLVLLANGGTSQQKGPQQQKPQQQQEENEAEAETRFRNMQVNLVDVSGLQSFEPNPPRKSKYIDTSSSSPAAAAFAEHPLVSQHFTSWDRFDLSFSADIPTRQVLESFTRKFHGLVIVQLVEYTEGLWIYSSSDSAEGSGGDAKVLDFPLGAWTSKMLTLKDNKSSKDAHEGKEATATATATATAAKYHLFVIMCAVKDEKTGEVVRGVVNSNLPLLRYSFGEKKAKGA